MTTVEEYSSVTSFLQSGSALRNGATVTTATNGDTVLTTRIRLADDPEEEAVDLNQMDLREIERLRDNDPFLYHSIVSERRRSSLFELDGDDDDDYDYEEGAPNMEFDLSHIERLRSSSLRGSLRGSITGLRRSSLLILDDDDDDDSFDRHHLEDSSTDPSLDRSGSGLNRNSDGPNHSGTGLESETPLNDAAPPRRPALTRRGSSRRMVLGRRRSTLCDVDEEGGDGRPVFVPSGGDSVGNSVHSGSANPVSVGSDPPPRGLGRSQSMQPVRRQSSVRRMSSGHNLRGSMTSLSSGRSSSSVVARKRRFSTEAHSSLIMANLSASLRGSQLQDSPDLDSLFDGEESDDDDMDLLNFLRQES